MREERERVRKRKGESHPKMLRKRGEGERYLSSVVESIHQRQKGGDNGAECGTEEAENKFSEKFFKSYSN